MTTFYRVTACIDASKVSLSGQEREISSASRGTPRRVTYDYTVEKDRAEVVRHQGKGDEALAEERAWTARSRSCSGACSVIIAGTRSGELLSPSNALMVKSGIHKL